MKKLIIGMYMLSSITTVGCGDETGTISIGGTLSGLGSTETVDLSLVAKDGTETLILGENGAFTFEDKLVTDETYAVSIAEQPDEQICAVNKGSGTAKGVNIANIAVTCIDVPDEE